MTRLHLPRAPCDKWVYGFPYGFLGIVGGYGVCVYITTIVRFFLRALGDRKSQSRTEAAWKSCSCRAASTASARKLYETRAASVQRMRGDSAVTCGHRASF